METKILADMYKNTASDSRNNTRASAGRTRKEDKRTKYTKMFLKEALLRLMEEKPVGQISTTELCKTAEINRNTFYSHYAAVQDVLSALEDEIEENLLKTLTFDAEPKVMIEEIIKNISENSKIFTVLLSPNGDFTFAKRLFDDIEDRCTEELRRKGINLSNSELHYLFSFVFIGGSAIVQCWLSEGMKKTPKEISALMFNLIENGISYYEEK